MEPITLPVLPLEAPDQYSCIIARQALQLLNSHILEEAELKSWLFYSCIACLQGHFAMVFLLVAKIFIFNNS